MPQLKTVPLFFWVITIMLPFIDPATRQPVPDPEHSDGRFIYELNYFCRLVKSPEPGMKGVFNEWDTDSRFAARFESEQAAENFRRVVLQSLDGSKVSQLIPKQIKTQL